MNNLKKSDTQKFHLTSEIQFIYSKYIFEDRVMHSKSNNIEIVINDKTDEIIKKNLITSFYILNWISNTDGRQ